MPIPGTKPKPDGFKRNHHPSIVGWLEVPNRPFENPPLLPKVPPRAKGTKAPSPSRPLGPHGRSLWDAAWADGRAVVANDNEALQQLCEMVDERVALRTRVITEDDWRLRNQLRTLDSQVAAGLRHLTGNRIHPPATWPALTRAWWSAISRMPHAATWTESEWRFAIDTAVVAAVFHGGDVRVAGELRAREKLLGTTADARRDLRIRYVSDDGVEVAEADQASVTAMADYKRMVAG